MKLRLIPTWDDMVDIFCTKYFHGEEMVMLATLQGIKQKIGGDLTEYIQRFRDIALDCCDDCEEKTLVEMCMGNMIVGAFSDRIGLPPAVTGWAASCDGGP